MFELGTEDLKKKRENRHVGGYSGRAKKAHELLEELNKCPGSWGSVGTESRKQSFGLGLALCVGSWRPSIVIQNFDSGARLSGWSQLWILPQVTKLLSVSIS